jgi:glycosyltransferase involved in cell wall biosynthesis
LNLETFYARPRLIYLVTEDWYFWSHRLPIARAARDAGYDVIVATRVGEHGKRIEAEGFRLYSLAWRRRGGSALGELSSLAALVRLYRKERPDIVHHIALKPVVVGSVAARFAGQRRVVNAINGLGFAFTTKTAGARLARLVLRAAFRLFIDQPKSIVLLQNDDDRRHLGERGFVRSAKMVVVRGSGVDIVHFVPLPPPRSSPPTIAVVTRMLAIKGIATLVAASRVLSERKVAHRLLLVGAPDPDNPSSLCEAELRAYAAEPGIEWLGHIGDVRQVWAKADIAALTSLGGEGLPKTLLEAAACGRPIVATDVPGCREVVRDGVNGFLVPPNDPQATATALARLITDAALRDRFGHESRRIVERDFPDRQVAAATLAIYRDLLDDVAMR